MIYILIVHDKQQWQDDNMRKNTKIIAIVFGTLVLSSLMITVLATKMTTLSFGMGTNLKPILTVRGFYDEKTTVFSGINYYFQLEPSQGTFVGWVKTTDGRKLGAYGTYTITKNFISGIWHFSDGHYGWISGNIGN